jgi:hypothetical protein
MKRPWFWNYLNVDRCTISWALISGFLTAALKWVIFSWPMLLIFQGVVNWIKRNLFRELCFFLWCIFYFPKNNQCISEAFAGCKWRFYAHLLAFIAYSRGSFTDLSKCLETNGDFAEWIIRAMETSNTVGRRVQPALSKKMQFSEVANTLCYDPEFKGGE